jgi:hypothetical protein
MIIILIAEKSRFFIIARIFKEKIKKKIKNPAKMAGFFVRRLVHIARASFPYTIHTIFTVSTFYAVLTIDARSTTSTIFAVNTILTISTVVIV